ncbi:fatty acid cis/trans isomerase [Vibrio viridaestus]|uniref:9-hexadecenoic acid cis-trans isomerase n=1 Tax=Vibrio viridaestus TaxID=2487322 RepID=A0A3N9TG47_9VIBR|nr:fatty acid cis/trans isomerase [Vibrio viridaestus]RQW62723.1 9-hexadecenoic acid cis-trans isomerase [Vibrio viridaestus]
MKMKKWFVLSVLFLFSGCSVYAAFHYDDIYGKSSVRERTVARDSEAGKFFEQEVKPVLDSRCVVCHACYDAPCQLKFSSTEGIDRGATKKKVYDGTRLVAEMPTRLFEDAQTTSQWRAGGFSPILNERNQSPVPNIEMSVMAQMLIQKKEHPLPEEKVLDGFDFSLNRDQQCPTIEEYPAYKAKYPDWGMPYGMPNLTKDEHETLISWLKSGAQMPEHEQISAALHAQIERFELFLNQNSLKNRLAARYIYEHLFLSHLYFADVTPKASRPVFFQLIRSKTPPGQKVDLIATRRPYDNPGVERVYYRFIPVVSTIVDKTHMPYALDNKKLKDWRKWFVNADYLVDSLPGYKVDVSANPMTSFAQLPVHSRFRFMLDNAQNTIMSFIKGPVCRGQLALNVINDHFWVFFIDPDKSDVPQVNEFYQSQRDNLRLPAEDESNTLPLTNWIKFSVQQANYLKAKSKFINTQFEGGRYMTTDLIWDGDGVNPNAALTVYRHFDSASVVQGLVGMKPKTAWIMDYELLERIHYLLVAGFDVYGNFGHQLMTRLFMDFMRLEGESNFMALLPKIMRHAELSSWYRDKDSNLSDFLLRNVEPFNQPTSVEYQTDNPKAELYDKLRAKLAPVLSTRFDIANTNLSDANEKRLQQISLVRGKNISMLPQIITILVRSESGHDELFTLLHNNAHKNISSLFDEEDSRDYRNDTLTLVHGVLGSYPAAFISLQESDVSAFVNIMQNLKSEEDYIHLLDLYGVRRTDSQFWSFSDRVNKWYRENDPVEYGLLDYNRFENR